MELEGCLTIIVLILVIAMVGFVVFMVIDEAIIENTKEEISRIDIVMDVEDKDIDTHTTMVMIGKVMVPQTRHDYILIYNNSKELEVEKDLYDSVSVGDKLKAEEVIYKIKGDKEMIRIENIHK